MLIHFSGMISSFSDGYDKHDFNVIHYLVNVTRTHIGRGLVFRWSATPPPQVDGVTSLPRFWGCFLYMRTPFVAELPNLKW